MPPQAAGIIRITLPLVRPFFGNRHLTTQPMNAPSDKSGKIR
jgi:hypothetical protein